MPLAIGHRGAAGTHPENTLVSFRRAIELGADAIELDVHLTVDGELVVIHDAFMDRTTTGTGLIQAMSLSQIKEADAGIKKGAQFAGERVPTLREVMREIPGQIFIEMKAGSIHYPGIEEALLRVIREEGAAGRVQISSFDHVGLKRINELAPQMPLGMLYSENLLDPIGMAQTIGAQALHPTWEWVTPDLVSRAHAAGLQVNTWNVNIPQIIQMVRAFGVDGIISDYPDRLAN